MMTVAVPESYFILIPWSGDTAYPSSHAVLIGNNGYLYRYCTPTALQYYPRSLRKIRIIEQRIQRLQPLSNTIRRARHSRLGALVK